MSDEDDHKTGRIAILAVLIAVLACFFFAYKVNACTEKADKPVPCKDEFFEIRSDSRARNEHTCSPGAVAEVVNSPPAPKPGIICHCTKAPSPASSP